MACSDMEQAKEFLLEEWLLIAEPVTDVPSIIGVIGRDMVG